jgi:hypothetical protein
MTDKTPTLLSSLRILTQNLKGRTDFVRYTDTSASIYDGKLADLNRDFRRTKINESTELCDEVKELLDAANIAPEYYGRFINARISGCEFLKELQQLKTNKNNKNTELDDFINQQLDDFIKGIDSLEQKKRDRIRFGVFVILAFAVVLSPILIPDVSSVFTALMSIGALIPGLGITYTVGVSLYSVYQTALNKDLSFYEKFRDNFFLLSGAALNITGYVVLITSAVTLNPVAGFLFILGSATNVILEAVKLRDIHHKINALSPILPSDSDVIQAEKNSSQAKLSELDRKYEIVRLKSEYIRIRKEIAFNLIAAVVTVGIIAAWCFIPGGLLVSIFALASIGVVYAVKSVATRFNEKASKRKLDANFKKVEEEAELNDVSSSLDPDLKVIKYYHEPKPKPKPELNNLSFNGGKKPDSDYTRVLGLMNHDTQGNKQYSAETPVYATSAPRSLKEHLLVKGVDIPAAPPDDPLRSDMDPGQDHGKNKYNL